MPYNSILFNPAPNAYHPDMTSTVRRYPAYTFRSRSSTIVLVKNQLKCSQTQRTDFPSPNAYTPMNSLNFSMSSPKFTLKGRTIKYRDQGFPAPNQYKINQNYNKSERTISVSSRYPKCNTFDWEIDHNTQVAPNRYQINRSLSCAPAYSIHYRSPPSIFGNKTLGNGPASYDKAKADHFVRKASANYKIAGRYKRKLPGQDNPAPNQYKNQENPYKRSKSWSFKSRHAYEGVNCGDMEFRYKFYMYCPLTVINGQELDPTFCFDTYRQCSQIYDSDCYLDDDKLQYCSKLYSSFSNILSVQCVADSKATQSEQLCSANCESQCWKAQFYGYCCGKQEEKYYHYGCIAILALIVVIILSISINCCVKKSKQRKIEKQKKEVIAVQQLQQMSKLMLKDLDKQDQVEQEVKKYQITSLNSAETGIIADPVTYVPVNKHIGDCSRIIPPDMNRSAVI